MQVEELRCDINGANAITFEKKLLAGERREQQRAAKCWSTGGGISPLHPSVQSTHHRLLVIAVSALGASTERV